VLRSLIDPRLPDLRSPPRDERALAIAARNAQVLAYDNLSVVSSELSDALCRLATGAGVGQRELFKDHEEVLFQGARPILLNGIDDFVGRADLADRSLLVALPPVSAGSRMEESELWNAFLEARPRLLGALLSAAAIALKEHRRTRDSLKGTELPRMADAAVWVSSAEGALGLKEGEVVRGMLRNRDEVAAQALEVSPLGRTIQDFVETDRSWNGTAGALLRTLNQRISGDVRQERDWPTSPRQLTAQLRRLAPSLRQIGIDWSPPVKRNQERIMMLRLIARGAAKSPYSDVADPKAEVDGVSVPSLQAAPTPEQSARAQEQQEVENV
jgi:hypothetical protein